LKLSEKEESFYLFAEGEERKATFVFFREKKTELRERGGYVLTC